MKYIFAAVISIFFVSCATFPTTRIQNNEFRISNSSFIPYVIQYGHNDFFVTKYESYNPIGLNVVFVKLGLKSNDLHSNVEYDFTNIKLKFDDGLRSPKVYRYFAGDNPFGFWYGGGEAIDKAKIGDGRYTVILGYLAKQSEKPSAIIVGNNEIPIPTENKNIADITNGFPDKEN